MAVSDGRQIASYLYSVPTTTQNVQFESYRDQGDGRWEWTAEIGLSFARSTILSDCPPEIWEGLPKHVNRSASEENQEQHIGT